MKPPPLQSLSIDRLVDMEFELTKEKNEGKENVIRRLIEVQRAIYLKLRRDRDNEYYSSLEKIKNDLISNLVQYGSYLKVEYRKDDQAADGALRQVLMIDSQNPIAHYRLGFLNYKKRNYHLAIVYFHNTLRYHKSNPTTPYSLNERQQYNATLYLSNSALHIATEAHEQLNKIEGDYEQVNYELSPIYSLIFNQDEHIQNNSYKILTKDSETYGSIQKCEEIIDSRKDEVILYFSDYEIFIYYKQYYTTIPISRASLLKSLMLQSDKKTPLTQYDLNDEVGNVLPNTFTALIGRLRKNLESCHIPSSIIQTRPRERDRYETGYYYNHSFPFIIIQRTDQ